VGLGGRADLGFPAPNKSVSPRVDGEGEGEGEGESGAELSCRGGVAALLRPPGSAGFRQSAGQERQAVAMAGSASEGGCVCEVG
jgi:hypothetical protein